MGFENKEIAGRIDAALAAHGVEPKELYSDLGWTAGEYSRKRREKDNRFHLKDIRRVVAWFIKKGFEPPPGWPFIDWELAAANQRALDILRQITPGAAAQASEPVTGKRAAGRKPRP